ncbi:glycosyltransferase family 4 protein [Candidatus Microgenomates bacterium]|nr:glycosyltransferase family 4 protein [Candidatus Microgenomates bacterium]
MKRLLFSISYYAPHLSGLTIAVQRVAQSFAAKGYPISVLTTQLQSSLPRTETIEQVQVTRVPFLFTLSKGFFMPLLLTEAVAALNKTDIVVIVLPQFEGALIALLAKLLRKKIVVWYVCEVMLPATPIARCVEFCLRLSHRLALSLADEVLSLTTDFAKHTPLLRDRKHVYGIAPLIVSPRVSERAKALLQKRIPKKKYTIGFLGRIAHEKGITYLLQTIPLLRQALGDDFVIVLAGSVAVGEDMYAAEVDTLLKQYSQHIVFLGKIAEEDKGAFYQLLDVLVLPSINNTEAFGMVQVEAMLCGTPVVATNLPGVRVPVQETGMGAVVSPMDSKALSAGIVTVLNKKSDYQKEQKKIAAVFDTEKLLNHYERVFFASSKTT